MTAGETLHDTARTRALLAAVLRGEAAPWPFGTPDVGAAHAMLESIVYHGVAGLLLQSPGRFDGWPTGLLEEIRQQALAEAMWELRHRDVVARLLSALAARGVPSLLLKGTAIAYILYEPPATRPRGDTDLLVRAGDVPTVRSILQEMGFKPYDAGLAFEWLQQGWTLDLPDGGKHSVDVHWSALNSPALAKVLPTDECLVAGQALPKLAPEALAMDPARLLVHTCVHRALHRTAPYMVGNKAFVGGDRLIWSSDIHRLAGSLAPKDWDFVVSLVVERRVAGACLAGLRAAVNDLGAPVPAKVMSRLEQAAPNDLPYLRSDRPSTRAWHDLRAMPGIGRKWLYLRSRLLPEESMLRSRYPRMADAPLPLLYLRRFGDALVRRKAT